MLTIQSKIAPSWYIPESERGSDNPARFRIQPLDGEQYLEVFAESEQTKSGDLRLSGMGLKLALQYGLTGWENVTDEKGKPLKFNANNRKRLPMEILSEIAAEIINMSVPEEAEAKN